MRIVHSWRSRRWNSSYSSRLSGVPFSVDTSIARRSVERFIEEDCEKNGLSPCPSEITLEAKMLPFIVFRGRLRVLFDGEVGYECDYNINGRALSRMDWYERHDIELRDIALNSIDCMMYAGMGLNRHQVERCIRPQRVMGVQPMQSFALPSDCILEPFSANPAYVFHALNKQLEGRSEHRARAWLAAGPGGRFVESRRQWWFDEKLKTYIDPSQAPRKPDKTRINNLRWRVEEAAIIDNGLVYMPVYFGFYTMGKHRLCALVNGVNAASVAGIQGKQKRWELENSAKLVEMERVIEQSFPRVPFWEDQFERVHGMPHEGRKSNQRRATSERAKPLTQVEVLRKMDDWKILGLEKSNTVTPSQVTAAYKRQARLLHPDRHFNKSATEVTQFAECFKLLQKAYHQVLKFVS